MTCPIPFLISPLSPNPKPLLHFSPLGNPLSPPLSLLFPPATQTLSHFGCTLPYPSPLLLPLTSPKPYTTHGRRWLLATRAPPKPSHPLSSLTGKCQGWCHLYPPRWQPSQAQPPLTDPCCAASSPLISEFYNPLQMRYYLSFIWPCGLFCVLGLSLCFAFSWLIVCLVWSNFSLEPVNLYCWDLLQLLCASLMRSSIMLMGC
jgi:hypothetical protein